MSQANVELVRSVIPTPDDDIIALFSDPNGELMQTMARALDPDFVSVKHVPGAEPDAANGLRGLRAGWLDWLAPWASYRAEIEEMIDLGDRVVAVLCDYARREREHLANYFAGWLGYEATVDDVIDAGDNVVVILRERARMRGSDAILERDLPQVFTVGEGAITCFRVFRTRADALRAVGLTE